MTRMRQDLEDEFQRRTANDKIRLFKRKCSGEFLVWDTDLDEKPPEDLQLEVFKFKDLSATFHQRRVTTSASDKIEQFPFSEDGTDKSGLQEHHQLPGLPVPFRKIKWKDRSRDIKRHLKPGAESIETTFTLSEENDGKAEKARRRMKAEIQMRNSSEFKSKVAEITRRHRNSQS